MLFILDSLGLDLKKYGVYSLRLGGVIVVVVVGVSDCFFKKYGCWKFENVKDGYVYENL